MITGRSIGFLELYHAWHVSGRGGLLDMPAKQADAVLILNDEFEKELARERQRT
jgi:hypothetical protein